MIQEPERSNAKRLAAGQLRIPFLMVILGAFSVAAAVAVVTGNGQILTPEPEAVGVWAKVIGVTLGVLSFALAMSVRPRTWQTLAMAIIGSPIMALMCWMLSWVIISQIYQHEVFSGRDVKSQEKDIPILVAEISHHKGTHYEIWLKSYSALLELEESDYVAAFGRTDRTRPIGYCVHAIVQTSGSVSRIIANHGISLPAGSVERCPSTPRQ